MRTWSPTFTLIAGPGTVPLNVQARTVLPGSTSQFASSAVRWNSLVPLASTFGTSGWLPTPFVFGPFFSWAVYVLTTFSIAASMLLLAAESCCVDALLKSMAAMSEPPPLVLLVPIINMACMPASR